MIGEKLKKRRLELGLTQEELAFKLGYKHKSAINKIEMNKRDVSQTILVRIAEALDCSPSYFLGDIPHEDHSAEVMEYAELLASLQPNDLDNAIQYIKFLKSQEERE